MSAFLHMLSLTARAGFLKVLISNIELLVSILLVNEPRV